MAFPVEYCFDSVTYESRKDKEQRMTKESKDKFRCKMFN